MWPRTLVVIPTYDEVENAPALVAQLVVGYPSQVEVLVVDDASPDGTAERLERDFGGEARVHVLRRSGKFGIGSAHLAGFRYGLEHGFEVLATMDGDRSHDPEYLAAMLDALGRCDMVIGSRYMPGGGIRNWKIHRRWLSRFANWYTRVLLDIPYSDCTSGYRCYRSDVFERAEAFTISASGYSFLAEMVWRVHRAGLAITEIPIQFVDRAKGTTKIESSEIIKAALHVLSTRRRMRRERATADGARAARRPAAPREDRRQAPGGERREERADGAADPLG